MATIFAIAALRTFASARRSHDSTDLTEINRRLVAIETMLRDVG